MQEDVGSLVRLLLIRFWQSGSKGCMLATNMALSYLSHVILHQTAKAAENLQSMIPSLTVKSGRSYFMNLTRDKNFSTPKPLSN